MTGWHADEITLQRWIDQSDSLPEGASVEQHLLSCAPCRDQVRTLVSLGPPAGPVASPGPDPVASPVDLAEVWARTRDAIELPRPSPFEWLLQRAGLPANDARLVATARAAELVSRALRGETFVPQLGGTPDDTRRPAGPGAAAATGSADRGAAR